MDDLLGVVISQSNDKDFLPADLSVILQRIMTQYETELNKKEQAGGVSLEKVKQLASHYKLNLRLPKLELISKIRAAETARRGFASTLPMLPSVTVAENIPEQNTQSSFIFSRFTNQNSVSTTVFRKNKATFPRLVNFLVQDVHNLLDSMKPAEKNALTARQVGCNHPAFVNAVNKFNDFTIDCGGFLIQSSIFWDVELNREVSGKLDFPKAYELWNTTMRLFSQLMSAYDTSGNHELDPFTLIDFIKERPQSKFYPHLIDMVHLYTILQRSEYAVLFSAVKNAVVLESGLDSGIKSPDTSSSKSSSNSNKIAKICAEKNEIIAKIVVSQNEKNQEIIKTEKIKRKNEEFVQLKVMRALKNECMNEIFELQQNLPYDDPSLTKKRKFVEKLENQIEAIMDNI